MYIEIILIVFCAVIVLAMLYRIMFHGYVVEMSSTRSISPPSSEGTTSTDGGETKILASHKTRKPSMLEKPHKCATCGDQCATNSALKMHICTHTGEKPFKCDMCGSSFATNRALRTHMFTYWRETLQM